MGYRRNGYDWCFINKIIDDKQCIILFHVESHVNPSVIYSVLADIAAEYGEIFKISITGGKFHKYLGMTID